MGNIAGVPHNKMVMDVTDDDFERILAINLKSCFYGCQAAMRVMAPKQSGNIINISSGAIDTPAPTLACYGMTKAAVAMLTKTLAWEAGPLGIRVNTLAPGVIHTNFSRHNFVDEKGDVVPEKVEEYKKRFGRMAPLGRVGEAQDVADSILFLVSRGRVVHDRSDPPPERRPGDALVGSRAVPWWVAAERPQRRSADRRSVRLLPDRVAPTPVAQDGAPSRYHLSCEYGDHSGSRVNLTQCARSNGRRVAGGRPS